ncbi:MAG: glutamate formimidoyltransferase [Lewinella sp.]|jgi:glutamate formiminotransferase/formiminotetrahydrofolate cyclodeaminase|uniref:glutamate formimidoyltransferase n=1 Tax=Lewinella sp. TaxID=2004506 RepID=UPI003D6A2C26
MSKKALIECVPNFSEGRDLTIIKQITDAIETVEGVKLLDVDPGYATNRTVVTFVGEPAAVVEAAFRGIQKAAELIDMRQHQGEHPRMGATDVCPLVPIANITMEEAAHWAQQLGRRVGEELKIPIYLYESAASRPERKNLATVRAGEYEGLADKLKQPEWKPDFGTATFNATAGATAIGARDFLIAYNVNLNTTSVRRANSVAFDIREKGRVQRSGNPITGPVVEDENGEPVRTPGTCKGVKAIGWFIEEYGVAQISMNITDTKLTALHEAFEATRESATRRGLRVTGSELVGLVPLQVMLDAGKYFLAQQQRSLGVSEEEIVKIAIKSLGLDELSPFDPNKKIIEYQLREEAGAPLAAMSLRDFANETASESPAPGGGSIAAYVGALGAGLGTMVANLSSHKRGWDDRWAEFSEWAERGQELKDQLLLLVDQDTQAFEGIMDAFRLPKGSDAEKAARREAIQLATKEAMMTPFRIMETSSHIFPLCRAMAENGLPASVSDAGVGALCARAAIHGAHLNVQINASGLHDEYFKEDLLAKSAKLAAAADQEEKEIMEMVRKAI